MRTSIGSSRDGDDDRHLRAEHEPGREPAGDRQQRPQHHERRFHRRRDQHVGAAGDLGLRRPAGARPRPTARRPGVSGPSTTRTARTCPARPSPCNATASVVERNAARRHRPSPPSSATFGAAMPSAIASWTVFRTMSRFAARLGETFMLRVGAAGSRALPGHVEEVGVRQPALGAQARVRRRRPGASSVLVGEAALDQRARPAHRARARGAGSAAARGRRRCRRAAGARCRARPWPATSRMRGSGPTSVGREVAGERARQRELQRVAVARVDEGRRQRRQEADALDELLQVRAGRHRVAASQPRPGDVKERRRKGPWRRLPGANRSGRACRCGAADARPRRPCPSTAPAGARRSASAGRTA